ncbi:methanobactin export MATE transporter MbnM [Niveispirillum sp. BGYR6]|uniref:methanobactin export MATE transporter MbnM n=1 Tax=Niveispirillum sp. BGYR6 TaxID=2971249 RepID=UPI0022B9B0C4|nr:methanobactin export MATE transporter MbnM [Niveispirillum sp. BGYR6]MDG5493920.1 di-heme enzyme [Niveispirillum sp. BGYR6]
MKRLILCLLLWAAIPASAAEPAWVWNLPADVPPPLVPSDNAMSETRFQLGRRLFYDMRLSGGGNLACASCHQQDKAFTDGRVLGLGTSGEKTARNPQGLANVAWMPTLTWANPALVTLERQMEVPLFGEHPVEMGVNDANRPAILARITADPAYQAGFAQAYPGEPVSFTTIIKAIASFQRGITSFNSRYDQYLRGELALNAAEERGRILFFGEKAECFHCHGSFNFNDQVRHVNSRTVDLPFHNTGQFNIDGKGAYPLGNEGLFEHTGKPTDRGAFRAPSLRNVEVTGPYMHDGGVPSLEQVLDNYAAGGRVTPSGPEAGDGRLNPHKSDLIAAIDLSPAERADIIAFLKTLTDRELLTNPRFADPFRR